MHNEPSRNSARRRVAGVVLWSARFAPDSSDFAAVSHGVRVAATAEAWDGAGFIKEGITSRDITPCCTRTSWQVLEAKVYVGAIRVEQRVLKARNV